MLSIVQIYSDFLKKLSYIYFFLIVQYIYNQQQTSDLQYTRQKKNFRMENSSNRLQTQPKLKHSELSTSENVWKILYLVFSVATAVLFKQIYHDRYVQFGTTKRTVWTGNLYHLLLAIPLMIFFHFYKLHIPKYSFNFVLSIICTRKYPTEQKRLQRANLLSKWVADIPYYLTTSIICFVISKDQQYFPKILGGPDNFPEYRLGSFLCKQGMQDYFQPYKTRMEIMYIIQLSHHMYAFLSHLLISKNIYGTSKYFEYLLHHFFALVLIIYSYAYDYWSYGIMVLLFHDFSDAVLQFGRFIVDTRFENFKRIFIYKIYYPITFFVWIACRIVMFPLCCIFMPVQIRSNAEYFMLSMQFGLFIMHIYWTYHLIKAFFSKANY